MKGLEGRKQCALVSVEHSQWQRSSKRSCEEVSRDQIKQALQTMLKRLEFVLRTSGNHWRWGVTHDMSQEQGAQESGDIYTSDWMPGWVKWVERKQADQVRSALVSKLYKTPWPESLKRRESTAVKVMKNFPKLTTMATNLKESSFLQKVFPDLRSGTNSLYFPPYLNPQILHHPHHHPHPLSHWIALFITSIHSRFFLFKYETVPLLPTLFGLWLEIHCIQLYHRPCHITVRGKGLCVYIRDREGDGWERGMMLSLQAKSRPLAHHSILKPSVNSTLLQFLVLW